MSRDFEEQLIDQLILDCSSLDQTAAAVFKAVFAAGRQSEFVKALTSYAGRKDSEIEKTCQLHYEQFAISIDILLGLREEAANLKQAVHSVLKELSYCGQLLFDTKVEMHETQKMLFITQKTVAAISNCLQALHIAQQATLEIMDQNFGQALRLIDQLQTSLLPRIDQFPFAAKLHQYIPSQLSTVRSFALEELKLWLSQVREQSSVIGALAFSRAQKRIEKWRELHDGIAIPTTLHLGYSVSASEDLRSASAYVDLVEMEREDAATIINNDQVTVDFAPLLKAVHLFTLMDQRSEFQAQFAEYRRAQAKVLFDMPVNLHDDEATSFAAFLHNVSGFFILEYFIVRKPQKFYSPAHVEGLWETALGMINSYVLEALGTLGGHSKGDLAVFMKIKWLQVFFLHAIEVYEIYSVSSMLDTILSLFYRYIDASKNETLARIREAACSGRITPLPITSSNTVVKMRRIFSFLVDDVALDSGEAFPFSEYVPIVFNCICDFIANFYVFLEGVPQHSTELDDIAKKNCLSLLEDSVRIYRERVPTASLEELIQMLRDFDAIVKSCPDLSDLVTRRRARSRASAVSFDCQDSCGVGIVQVQQRLLEILKKDLNEMFNRNRFNPTPVRASVQPSVLVQEFVQFYDRKLGPYEKSIPENTAHKLASELLAYLVETFSGYLMGNATVDLNMNFVENLALDIPFIQKFASAKIGNAWEMSPQFLEIQELVSLLCADKPHEFLDPLIRKKKYPDLRPAALIKALQNSLIVEGLMPPKFWRASGGGTLSTRAAGREQDGEEPSVANAKRFAEISRQAEFDLQMGFPPFISGGPRVGWMMTMQPTTVVDSEWPSGRSAVDYYFMAEDGSCFKATLTYSPYFFVKCKPGRENEVEEFIQRKFENTVEAMQRVMREDLALPNHLSGVRRCYLQLSFRNVNDLMSVRKVLLPLALRNAESYKEGVMSSSMTDDLRQLDVGGRSEPNEGGASHVIGLREFDIPYHLRVAIDLDIRVGLWYTVTVHGPVTQIVRLTCKDVRPDPVILAFDIETSKMPLKFPVATQDHIMMISYMVNGRGFLIVNRDIVSEDIEDFEYTPTPDFPGVFTIYNVATEEALLSKFFAHIQMLRPHIFVTYNGDFFDWPFVEARAAAYGMNMAAMIGISKNSQGEYGGTYCVHMDCFCWVKRDSYLPAGSHGLKAVCSIKLGYDPLELDPELMTPLANSDPHTLANYSVSDAVATYYLYMKYVHPFIYSLCNIIPLMPDEVLRKGTGTLCETLLMAQAFKANVIMPNKQEEARERFHKGHLLDSETYIGGHVEALEAGVYRSDFNYRFRINPAAMHQLVADLDRALKFFLEHESHTPLTEVRNYEKVYEEIKSLLLALAETPVTNDRPLIYHLDVGSMYPNIILTNRLQPSAMVTESTCAVCDFNRPGKQCQRKMTWSWRGEYFSAKQNEYKMIRKQLESERFPSRYNPKMTVGYHELTVPEQSALLKKRLADYSQKIYKRTKQNEVIQRTSIVCQRENSFYIDTVRSFRDRRYDYKNLQKVSKKNLEEAVAAKDAPRIEEASKLLVLYDSLQLAHKCILNSFYGYVMRKAARWYSMEMGGIVCETGAAIITLARQLIEQFGRPLELDTDGIWCMLPSGFPQNFSFELHNGKKVSFAYPCVMLNHLLFDRFTNHQYQTLVDPQLHSYAISSENSIFFEIDGPYKAMVLPSSTEEGRQLKKRYAVFNEDGSLAELKGFEIKRRGELKLVKIFQSQIFKMFLGGSNLDECYQEVATVANYWLDILYSKGASLEDFELIDLISENRSMSKSLDEYGAQKSTSISTAKRLAEFLGDQMVKDKGLACKFIISAKPAGLPVTNRAIPVAIFSAAPEIRRHYLAKWLRDASLSTADIRDIVDWEYYIERLGSMIQKLIVIPAAMQNVDNPVPRVVPPDWLKRGAENRIARGEQRKLTDMFVGIRNRQRGVQINEAREADIEDFGKPTVGSLQTAFKRPLSATTEPAEPEPSPMPLVDPMVDYSGWLASRKVLWGERIKRLSEAPSSSFKHASTLGSFLKQDRVNILKTPWQIIAIGELEVPGEYKLWALLGNTMRSFRLVCPRRIYFATKEPQTVGGSQVHFRLPDGLPAPNLYELVMPESIYRNEFIGNSATLLDPMLESIWESGVPLDFQVLVKMGAVVSVQPEVITKGPCEKVYFMPDEFRFRSTSEVPYLEDPGIVYAFCGALQSDSRAVFVLALSHTSIVRVLVVDDGMRRQLTALKSTYSQIVKNLDSSLLKGVFSLDDEQMQFEVDYFSDIESARRSLQKSFNMYLDDRPNPTILLSLGANQNDLMSMSSRVPHINLPRWMGSFAFPPLDWQRATTRHLLEYFCQTNEWLQRRLELCRYGHVPLANLPVNDPLLFISDLFLARLHRQQGYLLPWKNAQSLVPTRATSIATESLASFEATNQGGFVETPGFYRHVSVDFGLSQLAINAIMEFSHLSPDQETISPMFSLLRNLLAGWIKKVMNSSDACAVQLVENFYRWVRSGSSLLLLDCIRSRLQSIMDRSLKRLYEHLRHLGCVVIHGDRHRLLLGTTKDHIENAQAFVEYLMGELKGIDGLAWIKLNPSAYWQTLLWMDSNNFAGIPSIRASQSESGDEEKESDLRLRLNLADYLPPLLQHPFHVMVAEYVMQAQKGLFSATSDNTKGHSDDLHTRSLLIEEEDEKIDESTVANSTSDLVSAEYRQRFLTLIREVQRLMSGAPSNRADAARRAFPVRPGSHLQPTSGPLEFIKYLGALFTLDKNTTNAAFTLIKQSYALLGVREFSDETVFVDPCISFALADVICAGCCHVRDLDFCRDADIVALMERNATDSATLGSLACPVCAHPYDMHAIEAEIVDELSRMLRTYQQQDLHCGRCRSVKADLMVSLCQCAGKYETTINRESLEIKIRIVSRVAKALRLSALGLFIRGNFLFNYS